MRSAKTPADFLTDEDDNWHLRALNRAKFLSMQGEYSIAHIICKVLTDTSPDNTEEYRLANELMTDISSRFLATNNKYYTITPEQQGFLDANIPKLRKYYEHKIANHEGIPLQIDLAIDHIKKLFIKNYDESEEKIISPIIPSIPFIVDPKKITILPHLLVIAKATALYALFKQLGGEALCDKACRAYEEASAQIKETSYIPYLQWAELLYNKAHYQFNNNDIQGTKEILEKMHILLIKHISEDKAKILLARYVYLKARIDERKKKYKNAFKILSALSITQKKEIPNFDTLCLQLKKKQSSVTSFTLPPYFTPPALSSSARTKALITYKAKNETALQMYQITLHIHLRDILQAHSEKEIRLDIDNACVFARDNTLGFIVLIDVLTHFIQVFYGKIITPLPGTKQEEEKLILSDEQNNFLKMPAEPEVTPVPELKLEKITAESTPISEPAMQFKSTSPPEEIPSPGVEIIPPPIVILKTAPEKNHREIKIAAEKEQKRQENREKRIKKKCRKKRKQIKQKELEEEKIIPTQPQPTILPAKINTESKEEKREEKDIKIKQTPFNELFQNLISHEEAKKLFEFITILKSKGVRVLLKGSALMHWLMRKHKTPPEPNPKFTPNDIDFELDCTKLSSIELDEIKVLATKFGLISECGGPDNPSRRFINLSRPLYAADQKSTINCDITIEKPGYLKTRDPIPFTNCRAEINLDGSLTMLGLTEDIQKDLNDEIFRIHPPTFEESKDTLPTTCFLARGFKYYYLFIKQCGFKCHTDTYHYLINFDWLRYDFLENSLKIFGQQSVYDEFGKLFDTQKKYQDKALAKKSTVTSINEICDPLLLPVTKAFVSIYYYHHPHNEFFLNIFAVKLLNYLIKHSDPGALFKPNPLNYRPIYAVMNAICIECNQDPAFAMNLRTHKIKHKQKDKPKPIPAIKKIGLVNRYGFYSLSKNSTHKKCIKVVRRHKAII